MIFLPVARWNRRFTLRCAVVLAFLVTFPTAFARADEKGSAAAISRDDIVRAWNRRKEQVRSARFEWSEVRNTTADLFLPGETRVEPDDPQYGVDSSLSLKGDQIRHTFRKSIWRENAPRGENEYVSVSNGTTSKVYLPPGYVSDYPMGHATNEYGSNDIASVYLKPFLWTFRTSTSGALVAPMEVFDVVPDHVIHQGRECVILRHRASPTHGYDVWVDPSRDFLIVRQQFVRDGRVGNQLDIDYEFNDQGGVWVPSDWRFAMLNSKGNPIHSVNGTLTRAEINVDIPDTDFEFDFPEGTLVHEGQVHQHIVMADGTQRPIAVSDRGLPYDVLLSKGTGSVGNSFWKGVWVKANIIVFVCAGACLILHRYRSSRVQC